MSVILCVRASAFAQNAGVGVDVIVIDAGHGGAFPGAVYGKVKEKDLNLAVALKLGALIEKELPGVKVVYTRKTDTALGKTLNEDLTARANIANRAEGDFFISIHANAAKSTSVYGVETIIMGESEKETRYNESALYNNNKEELIDMSDENTAAMVRAYIQNLQFTYGEYSEMMARLMQSHYARGGRNARRVNRQLLKVLYATDMPSVLTEIGFMTNPKELAYMASDKGQRELARMLCNAVKEYVAHINKLTANAGEGSVSQNNAPVTTTPQPVPATVQSPATKSVAEGYTIQVLASDKRVKTDDSQFKSYRGKIKCYEGGGVLKYKYCYGKFSSQAEAQRHLATVRSTFKGAFVVRFKDDKIVK
jgi:N-acetylmuramoyl-L-alanine amidase